MTNFNDIPDEKFEGMQNAIMKNLKVKNIDIQNIKNIDYINTTFSDWVVVTGNNGNGKTSLVDSIFLALKGPTLYGRGTEPVKIIKHGEKKASITMTLKGKEKEFVIQRKFKQGNEKNPGGTQSFEAYFENGEKISQNELSELINVLTIDPLKLDKMNIPDSIKEVQKITGLDTTEINKKISDTEEERKYEKQGLARINALIENYTTMGIPEKVEKVNINKLLEKQKGFQKLEDKKEEFRKKKEDYELSQIRVEELEKELIVAKENAEKKKQEAITFKDNLKKEIEEFIKENGTEEENDIALQNTQETNEKASKYEEYLKYLKDKEEAEKGVQECEETVEKLRAKKLNMIKNSKMPDYMEVSETYGILVDGIEYKQLNTARKIEVAIDLVLISGSPLRVLNIEEGGELDIETLSKIQDKILDKGFQIFIQRAKIDEFNTIIIEQGEIIEDEQEKKKIIQKEKEKENNILNKLKNDK